MTKISILFKKFKNRPFIILDEEKNMDMNKILNLKVNIDNPSSEIVKEKTYEDLYRIMEKLASKRRTGSDNLISKTNMKMSNQKQLSKPSNLHSPQNQYFTPDKSQQNFQFQPNFPSQNKIQSMNFSSLNNSSQPKFPVSQKNTKVKGLKTIDNPEMLGFHKNNMSKMSNSDNCPKKIIFTEPDMNYSENPNFLKKKYSKFSNPKKINRAGLENLEKNKSLTNFLKPNYSTGLTSNSRPTKPTEEDFESEEISESKGKNCETSQEIINLKENYLAEGGFDYEIIEKMNELSDGVKYTFGGVGVSQEEEQKGDEEVKNEEEHVINKANIPSLKELKHVISLSLY